MFMGGFVGSVSRVTMENVNSAQVEFEEEADGVYLADLATGQRACMKYWRIEPGAALPVHRHDNEQIGYVLSGSLIALIDGEEVPLSTGDCYRFRSGEPHGTENREEEPAVGIGVLAPPRERPDWGH